MKLCPVCRETKSPDQFRERRAGCRPCEAAKDRKRRADEKKKREWPYSDWSYEAGREADFEITVEDNCLAGDVLIRQNNNPVNCADPLVNEPFLVPQRNQASFTKAEHAEPTLKDGVTNTVIAVGDIHFPFHSRKALDGALKVIEQERPKAVVQVGDLYDFYSASRFPRNHSLTTPKDEMDRAREAATWFWAEVQKRAPQASCYQILGNHDDRPMKKAAQYVPELLEMVQGSWRDMYTFKGVTSVLDGKEDLPIDGVIYEHGHQTPDKIGSKIEYNGKSTVFGHTHRASLWFRPIRNEVQWEMNVGHLADPTQEPLRYTPKKYTRWIHAVGVVRNGWPYIVPIG